MTEPKKMLSAKAMLKMLEARQTAAERVVLDAAKACFESPDVPEGDALEESIKRLRDAEALVAAAKGGA